MATYKHSEQIWDYTPVAAATAGDVVLLGPSEDVVAVVVADIAAGKLGSVYTTGVFEFTTADTFEDGENAYWNASSEVITDDGTDVYAGRVVDQPTTTTVRVAINFGFESAGS